jgi:hypothetical protein
VAKGLKPQVIEVSVRGRIDEACKGKTMWDDIIRSIAPRVVDVSIVHVRDLPCRHGKPLSMNG